MVACNDIYKISSQLAKGLNEFDFPYGRINMIFSGDFAQLPPVFGYPLYSGTVGTQLTLMSCITVQGQKAAIGKALKHQGITVQFRSICHPYVTVTRSKFCQMME